MVSLRTLKKTISKLEVELAAARAAQETILIGSPMSESLRMAETTKRKYLMVIGINTAFNSRKRRDSVRATWMPQGMLSNLLRIFFLYYFGCHCPYLNENFVMWTIVVKYQVMKERS